MTYLAASVLVIGSVVGIFLTVVTLPGTWLTVAVALGCKWWEPDLLSWWTIGAATALAGIGEAVDFGASAVGAARTGGGRSAAVGSVVGGIGGAIIGSMVVPIIGTIIGAVVGAGLGAGLSERGVAQRPWKQSARVGAGAAAGKAVATVVKIVIAAAMAVMLSVAAFVS